MKAGQTTSEGDKMSKILRLLLLASTLSLFGCSGQTYTVTLKPTAHNIVALGEGYDEIQMEGFGSIGIPGKPALPAKTFMIALPPGAQVDSLRTNGVPHEIAGEYKINPAPMQLPKSTFDQYIEKAKKKYEENLRRTYDSDELFPSEVVKYEGMGNLRKWRFAYIKFYPFQYRPKSGKLVFFKQITITLDYTLPSKDSREWEDIRKTLLDDKADKEAERLFVNYEDALRWYKTERR